MSYHEYDSDYIPAMPICQVYLGVAQHEPTLGPLDALVDTGADVTVIPTKYIRQLGAKRVGRGKAHNLWGTRTVDLYAVAFALNGLRFKALRVIADNKGDEIVLGRFVLNRLKVVLDGPSGMLEIAS